MKKEFDVKKCRKSVPTIYKRTSGQKTAFAVVFAIFVIYSATLLAPLLMIFLSSFKDALTYNDELFAGTIYNLPKKVVFSNYSRAFSLMKVPVSHGEVGILAMTLNTLWSSVLPAGIATFTVLCTGYVCARYTFPGNRALQTFALGLMILPVFGTGGASLKLYMALGIYNNPLGMLLSAFQGFGMSFFIVIGFFKGVSREYAEAVFIDGGGHFTAFLKIMLPQASSIALVFFIGDCLLHYSDYTTMLLYMPDYVTIATGLYFEQMLLPRLGETPVYFAALFMSAVPIALIYIFFGKKFMTSMNIGGLKG